jgi:hypothetical protein
MYWHRFCLEKKKSPPMIKLSLTITLSLLFLSCNPSEISEEQEYIPQGTLLRLNSYTETCQGLIEMQCLLVQTGDQIGTDTWEFFYNAIDGFDYEEGFLYDLDVKITEIENPPADASSLRYELIKLIEKFKP